MRPPGLAFPLLTILVATPAMYVWHHQAWLPVRPGRTYSEQVFFDPGRVEPEDIPITPHYPIPSLVAHEYGADDLVSASKKGWVLVRKFHDPEEHPREVLQQREAQAVEQLENYERVTFIIPVVALLLGIWFGLGLRSKPRTISVGETPTVEKGS